MKFYELAKYLEKLEKTSSRNEITRILSDVFKKAEKGEINKIVYLVLGELAPSYQGVVLNIADKMMLRIIAQAYDAEINKVKSLYKQKGDLGDVSENLAQGQGGNLGVKEVFDRLLKVAQESGEGSQERKVSLMAKLLGDLDPLSSRFVARIPLGKLRLGFSELTILDALSWMAKGDKSASPKLQETYQVLPDIGLLVKRVKDSGVDRATRNISPVWGIPILPMLAQRITSPLQMIEKMGEVYVEPKYDGVRLSIHYKRNPESVKAFTRNMNEISSMFPELKEIGTSILAKEVVIDTEAVGMDEKRKAFVDFQTTMKRRRKYDTQEYAAKLPLKFYVFDILHKNGKNIMALSYKERRKILEGTIKNGRLFQKTDQKLTKNPEVIKREYKRRLSEGLEGVMVKKTDSPYVPGRTGWRWVKMKQAEGATGKLTDTIDCIVMGFSSGKGKRTKFGLGKFLVGVRDGEKIKTTTRVGTGLKDEAFIELNKNLEKLMTKDKPKEYEVTKNQLPDFWVTPKIVVEIAGDDITKSPTHTSGYGVRFPRMVRIRTDKSPKEATTLGELEKLFEMQKG